MNEYKYDGLHASCLSVTAQKANASLFFPVILIYGRFRQREYLKFNRRDNFGQWMTTKHISLVML